MIRPPWARRSSPTRSSPSCRSRKPRREPSRGAGDGSVPGRGLGARARRPAAVRAPLVPGAARARARLPARMAVRARLRALRPRRCCSTSGCARRRTASTRCRSTGRRSTWTRSSASAASRRVRLQGWLYDGSPGWFEDALGKAHDWYFGGLLAALFLLWLGSRREYLRAAAAALGCAYAAVVGFVAFPAAPRGWPAVTTSSGRSSASASTATSARRPSTTPRSRRASSTTTPSPPSRRCTAPGRRWPRSCSGAGGRASGRSARRTRSCSSSRSSTSASTTSPT